VHLENELNDLTNNLNKDTIIDQNHDLGIKTDPFLVQNSLKEELGTRTDQIPITEPKKEEIIEPITEPITEPIIEPITEPNKEEIIEPITEEIIEPIIEPKKVEIIEPIIEPITETKKVEIINGLIDLYPNIYVETPKEILNNFSNKLKPIVKILFKKARVEKLTYDDFMNSVTNYVTNNLDTFKKVSFTEEIITKKTKTKFRRNTKPKAKSKQNITQKIYVTKV
jgi:nucleoid DNA-binding protein